MTTSRSVSSLLIASRTGVRPIRRFFASWSSLIGAPGGISVLISMSRMATYARTDSGSWEVSAGGWVGAPSEAVGVIARCYRVDRRGLRLMEPRLHVHWSPLDPPLTCALAYPCRYLRGRQRVDPARL